MFKGVEEITGTTVSLSGLGMPAPSRFNFRTASGDYTAALVGTITSELLPRWPIASRIRAYGRLALRDSAGDQGTLELKRSGEAIINVMGSDGKSAVRRVRRELGAGLAES